ncbi:hypothetical protein [Streptomyces prunicolor]
MNAAEFNRLYEVGVPVFAYPGARPEDGGKRLVTRTRERAEVLSGHTDVVWVEGDPACIALRHVDVVSEDVWEAARTADAVAELGALPVDAVPQVSGPKPRTMLDHGREALNARMSKDDLRLVLENVITYAASLEGRIAELEALVPKPKPKDARACANCGSVPEYWCPDCAACQRGCYDGFKDNPCTHPNAPWPKSGASAERSADRLTEFFAPVAALREDPHDGPLAHPYRVGRDLPELGGAK